MESLCHIITSRKGVTYKDTLSMLLYGFSLLPQAEAMSEADTIWVKVTDRKSVTFTQI